MQEASMASTAAPPRLTRVRTATTALPATQRVSARRHLAWLLNGMAQLRHRLVPAAAL